LPNANIQAPVLTFESGEKKNAVEQVIYISGCKPSSDLGPKCKTQIGI